MIVQDNAVDVSLSEPIVVFGGAGFIGTHLLKRLRDRGSAQVISVDIRAPKRAVSGVDYRIGDVRDLSELDLGKAVPLIFNLAAIHTTPGHEPWEYYGTNVHGALEVTRFAKRSGTRQIVFTSSISVYGPDEVAKDETALPAPTSDYGRSKQMAEKIHIDWLNADLTRKLVIARPAVVFGHGEGGNFTRLANMLSKGYFFYPGRRDTIKSCIYVRDLLDWLLVAVADSERFILFNGAFSNRYTIEQIVDTFRLVAFPMARTKMVPATAMKLAAALLRPISMTGLGIHPERIEKLMVSTNILPAWAEQSGLQTQNQLEAALRDWMEESNGRFN